jgi:hypothetical protein
VTAWVNRLVLSLVALTVTATVAVGAVTGAFPSGDGDGGESVVTFMTLVRWFGLPGALFLTFIALLMRGYFVTGREAIKDKKAAESALLAEIARREAEVQALKQRYEQDQASWRERYDKMETEKNFWRDTSLRNMEVLEDTTKVARKAVEKLPKREG